MPKAEPNREEILDTLETVYAWHSMPGREFFKRYGDKTIYSKMWGAVRSTLERAGRNLEWETKRVSKSRRQTLEPHALGGIPTPLWQVNSQSRQ